MQSRASRHFLKQLKNLTPSQKEKVVFHLHQNTSMEKVESMVDSIDSCPYCSSQKLHKWGIRDYLQRYRCRSCHKTFNALTGTPLARLRYKEVWIDFAQDLIEGVSVRKSAAHCGVNKNTTFRWRHRMLNNTKKDIAKHLNGIVEFDETYFLNSHKGEHNLDRDPRHRGGSATQRGISSPHIAVLVARDRSGHIMDAILFKSNKNILAEVMIPIVNEDALFCSDSKTSYRAFAKKYHLTFETISASAKEYVRDTINHIQNINANDSRLKALMKHFNGVATKYLEGYLVWMYLLDRENSITPELLLGMISKRNMICQPLM